MDHPSIWGRTTSRTIRSYSPVVARNSPSAPVSATSTVKPFSPSPLRRWADVFASSSTTRIFIDSYFAGALDCRVLVRTDAARFLHMAALSGGTEVPKRPAPNRSSALHAAAFLDPCPVQFRPHLGLDRDAVRTGRSPPAGRSGRGGPFLHTIRFCSFETDSCHEQSSS